MQKSNFSNSTENEISAFYKKVSQNIKRHRELKNITQLDLALDIGIKSVAFYSNCENCRYGKHFNLKHIYNIAKSLNVDIEEFIKISKDDNPIES